MTRELLDVWITRLVGRSTPLEVHPNRGADMLDAPGGHLLITTDHPSLSRQLALAALRQRAVLDAHINDGRIGAGTTAAVRGWLAVDVPIARSATATQLAHRMIRRLYFTAVLHGLGERRELREAVHGMRRSYLQTRGAVTVSESETRVKKSGGELGVTLDLLKPLTGKLTAASELEVAESLVANMARFDLLEAEDQLLFDLEILAQLNAHVDRFATLQPPAVPRWETVRAFFKSVYGRVAPKTTLSLRPVFVFDAWGPGEATALFAFLAEASGLKSAGPAQLVVHGGPTLRRLVAADWALGHIALRPEWHLWAPATPVPPLGHAEKLALRTLLASHPSPVIKTLLDYALRHG